MKPASIAAQWGAIRRVYPIYTAVAEEFALGPGPYAGLDQLTAESEAEAIGKVQDWLGEMDTLVQPHQFRYILERTDILSSEDRLRALVHRYLGKDPRTGSDREKLHYLLNQYVRVCGPPSFRARDVTFDDIAQVLEPVLGEAPVAIPEWLAPLTQLTVRMAECPSLQELQSSILARGRELKNGDAEQYFSTSALQVFTHFNYCARRAFTRLLGAELQAIDDAIGKLDSSGVKVIDCTASGFGERETVDNIRLVLDELRTSTSPAYSCDSSDAVVQRIQELRKAIEAAVPCAGSGLSDADERRVRALESQVQQLTSQLAQSQVELSGLRKIVARLAAQARTAAAASPLTAPTLAVSPAVSEAPAPLDETAEDPEAPPTAACDSTSASSFAVPDVPVQVQGVIEEIRRSLGQPGKASSGVVKLGAQTVLLSAGEVDAMNSTLDVALMAQQAIGVRSLLLKFIEGPSTASTGDISALSAYGHTVLSGLQQTLGSSTTPMRDALAASARQLRTVLQHAEHAARKSRLLHA